MREAATRPSLGAATLPDEVFTPHSLVDTFTDGLDGACDWLATPHRSLAWRTPAELAREGRFDRVQAALGVLQAGIFLQAPQTMLAAADWNAGTAVASRPLGPWRGTAWRMHAHRQAPLNPGGAQLFSGRYHRGRDRFPTDGTWPALYLALGPEIGLGEVLRHLTLERLSRLNDYRLSEIALDLTATLDGRDAAAFGLPRDVLLHDIDYRATQGLATAAVAHGVEGLLVPSATLLGDNVVVVPANLGPGSRLEVVTARDPRLSVPRP